MLEGVVGLCLYESPDCPTECGRASNSKRPGGCIDESLIDHNMACTEMEPVCGWSVLQQRLFCDLLAG